MGRIEPETLILLQDSKLRHHIVLTALAFQHRHLQRVQVPPSRFQAAPVMAIAGELVGIAAPTGGTLPVDQTRLATHRTGTALRASQLDGDFLLQKLLEHLGHSFDDHLLHLAFNGLQNGAALRCL